MRWMVLIGLAVGWATASAADGDTIQPFPETGTVLEVEVTKFSELPSGHREATLKVIRIFGEPLIHTFEGTDRGVIIVDKKVSKGSLIQGGATDPPRVDSTGSPVVWVLTEGELGGSSIQLSKRYLYIHAGHYFEVTPERLAMVKKTR